MTPPSTVSCLLVDDDNVFRDRLARALVRRGWQVSTAATPPDALSLWSLRPHDAAVVDLRLQTASGLQLIPDLRRVQPRARIVVLTGFGSITTAVEAGRLGVAEYLTKPVDVDRLLAAMVAAPHPPATSLPETPSLDLVEWEHIQRVLADCQGNVSQAARLLRIDRRSLQRKLAKHPPRD